MQSHVLEPLPEEMRKKLEDLMWEIELWHIRHLLVERSKAKLEGEWFFNELVSGVIDCFYYFGWSRRKPVTEMLQEDIWPVR